MSKLSVHLTFPGNTQNYGEFLRIPAAGGNPVAMVYQLNANTKADVIKYSPTTKLIYRRQSDVWQRVPGDLFRADPATSCQNWMLNVRENGKNLMDLWALNPADYYDPLNEPVPQTVDEAKWLNTWMLHALDIGNRYGFKLAMFSFSVGRPEYDLWQYFCGADESIGSLQMGKQYGAILSLHEYGVEENLITRNPDGSLTQYCLDRSLRHRKVWSMLPEDCRIPIIISEAACGNGYGVPLTGQPFLNDATEYDKEIMKDSYVIAANLFQLGGNESNLQPVLLNLANYISVTPTTEPEPEPLPEPPPESDKLPYVVKVHLLPNGGSLENSYAVQELAYPNKQTVAYSADDAKFLVEHGQPGSTVFVYDPDTWPNNILNYFNNVNVEVRYLAAPPNPPVPPTFAAKRGVGMGKRELLTGAELDALKISRANAFLALTLPDVYQSQQLITQVLNANPNISIVGRLFFSADPINKTLFNPQAFVDYCKGGLEGFYSRGVRYFQIHNEPNLSQEGFGWNWRNGAEFGNWLVGVINILRVQYPEAEWGYPGLSPQPNTEQFWADSKFAMDQCDWVGVHSYWQTRGTTGWGMESLDGGYHYKRLKTNKPLMITEFSNNLWSVPAATKGQEYVDYYALNPIPAFNFCLSWYDDPNKEGWVQGGKITDIPRVIGQNG